MTARVKAPDAALAELHKKRVDLASRRNEASAAQGAAERVVAGVADRRRAVLLADARGQEHTETVEQVDLARRQAEVAIADGRERADVLKLVERDVEEEVEALIDAHPAHFLAQAVAASEAASEALAAASQATSAAVVAWGEARAAWGVVRMSRGRRKLDRGPEIPIHDLGGAVHELSQSQTRAWPGGRREVWEQWLAKEAESGRRANASSSPRGPEPLLERI
jgi:hypothetical protein